MGAVMGVGGRGMKGLILSGGTGSRLRPLTYTGAKQLIPVGNKPILFYAIEALRESGVTDIAIIVGDTRAEIRAAVGDGSAFGVRITYIEQERPLGLAHAVKIAQGFLGDDSFIMFLGDNLVRGGVDSFVRQFRSSSPAALVLLSEVPEPQHFGVVELEDGRVKRLVEKPKVPPSNLALVGVYLFQSDIFRAVGAIQPSARGELEITDAIQWLVDNGHTVEPHLIRGWWKDTGRPDDVLDANRLMLEALERDVRGDVDELSHVVGRVQIGPGSRVVRSTLRGPIVIGEDVVIEDAYIGPFTSISDRAQIYRTEIENSVVLEESHIESAYRIDGSLIGRRVQIVPAVNKPKAIHLVLGDDSRCEF